MAQIHTHVLVNGQLDTLYKSKKEKDDQLAIQQKLSAHCTIYILYISLQVSIVEKMYHSDLTSLLKASQG